MHSFRSVQSHSEQFLRLVYYISQVYRTQGCSILMTAVDIRNLRFKKIWTLTSF